MRCGPGRTFSCSSNTSSVDYPRYISSDADKLRHVLANIPDNAIKYTDRGKCDACVRMLRCLTLPIWIRPVRFG